MNFTRATNRLRTADPRYVLTGMRRLAISKLGMRFPRRLSNLDPDRAVLRRLADTPACPGESDPVIEAADRFLVGGISLLGRDMQPWIEGWRTDPRTGFTWPASEISQKLPPGTDVKVPWEISRFYFAPWLAGATAASGDKRYANALGELVTSWEAENPQGVGVNWKVPMEASIRAANWVIALAAVSDMDDEFNALAEILETPLNSHGAFVARNLEAGPGPPTNHLLVGAAGLAIIGVALGSEQWTARALRTLERQAVHQVTVGGSHVEGSVSYHRFCMEAFAAAAWALRASGNSSDAIEGAVTNMLRFATAYARPDGTAPELGDADDGRFVVPSGMFAHEKTRHEYLQWLLPPGAIDRSVPASCEIFDGYAFLRNEHEWVSFRCGRFGRYGGHVHADQLHVTWSAGDLNVLLDPGTGDYTGNPELRNRLRSAVSHNAPLLDGREPNQWQANDLFFMADDTKAELVAIGDDCARGRHTGYSSHTVTREVRLTDDLTVQDSIEGTGEHSVRWTFVLGGQWELEGVCAKGTVGDTQFEIALPTDCQVELNSIEISREYGELREVSALRASWRGNLPARFEFKFRKDSGVSSP